MLEYNGANWSLFETPNETIMRSVKYYNGKIYTGFYMDFGFWEKDEFGELVFTSLVNRENIKMLEDEQIWNIIEADGWIIFKSLQRIYLYNIQSKSVKIIDAEKRLNKISKVDGVIYFHENNKGLFKIENGKPKLVVNDKVLKENIVVEIFKKEGKIHFVTQEKGFYYLDNNKSKKWNIPADDLLENQTIYSAKQLSNKDFALGTISNGIISLNAKGELIYQVGQSSGLSNNTVLSIFEDRENNVWLGLDNGINCINNTSAFFIYDKKSDFLGTIYTSIIFKDTIYLGTNQGLFYRPLNSNEAFQFVKETEGQVWNLIIIDNELFCGHDSGTFLIKDKNAESIFNNQGTWNIVKIDNKTIIQGCYDVDDKIQLRAAKIINKYGDIASLELREEVSLYGDSLFFSSKELLSNFLDLAEEDVTEDEENLDVKFLTDSNRVEILSTFDELLFFVSQVLDNNDVHHIDLFLSYVPKLNLLINSKNVVKLEPIFKRALDLTFSFDGWNSQIGELEFKAAYYLNDFSEILIKKYPNELQNFKTYKTKKIEKLKKENFFKHYKGNLKEIEHQSINDRIYHIHQSLFIASKKLIKAKIDLEFLSTPTHYPCWICPEILIDRIKRYENSVVKINPYDMQIALARLPINEFKDSLLNKIKEIQNTEIKELLQYFYDFLPLSKANIQRKDIWIQAIICKKNTDDINYFKEFTNSSLEKELTNYNWNCNYQNHIHNVYDYEKRKYVDKTVQKKEVRFFSKKEKIKETFFSTDKIILQSKKRE